MHCETNYNSKAICHTVTKIILEEKKKGRKRGIDLPILMSVTSRSYRVFVMPPATLPTSTSPVPDTR